MSDEKRGEDVGDEDVTQSQTLQPEADAEPADDTAEEGAEKASDDTAEPAQDDVPEP